MLRLPGCSAVGNQKRPAKDDRDHGASKGRYQDEEDAAAYDASPRLNRRAFLFHDHSICTLRGSVSERRFFAGVAPGAHFLKKGVIRTGRRNRRPRATL